MNRELQRQLTRIGNTLGELRDLLNQLLDLERQQHQGKMALRWGPPGPATVNTGDVLDPQFQSKGESLNMSGKETDTQSIPCSAIETDGAGNPVTINPANAQWSVDDPTVASVSLDPSGNGNGVFKAIKPVPPAVNPRTSGVKLTDTKTGVVGTESLEVDDSPTQPGKMVLTFGTPA